MFGKKMKRLMIGLVSVSAALALAGCSAVFTSTITGQVVEKKDGVSDPVGIDDVAVYAFLSESERATAISAYEADGTLPKTSGRIFHDVTETVNTEAGHYTISIIWESTSALFGKTADRIPIYLAFYHKDFGLVSSSNENYMTSDKVSTMIRETLDRINVEYTINLVVKNVAGAGTGDEMTLPAGMRVTVKEVLSDNTLGDTLYSAVPSDASVSFVYPEADVPDTGLQVAVSLTASGSTWRQTDAAGAFIDTTNAYTLTDTTYSLASSPLYLKNLQIDAQTVSGRFTGGSDDDTRDNRTVWLLEKEENETAPAVGAVSEDVPKTVTTYREMADESLRHGYFTLTAGSWTATESDYPGRYASKTYWLVVSQSPNATRITSGDSYQEVTVTNNPNDGSSALVVVDGSHTV